MIATSPVAAQENHINIDIGKSFDWSSDAINKVAKSTAKVFHDRCSKPCTIKVRVFIDGSMRNGLSKHLIWLKNSIEKEMRRRSRQEVEVIDAIHIF